MLGYRPGNRLIDLVMGFSWVNLRFSTCKRKFYFVNLSCNTLDQMPMLYIQLRVTFPFKVPFLSEKLEGKENFDKKNCNKKSLTVNQPNIQTRTTVILPETQRKNNHTIKHAMKIYPSIYTFKMQSKLILYLTCSK